jgi:tetratricopeptide (TPR) repeat protein
VALTLKTRADAALWLGRYPEARAFSEAGLAIAREIGRHNILAVWLRGRGMVEIIEGDYARAVRLLREGVAAARRVRSYNIGTCAVLSSLAALRQGQTSPSRRYLYEGLQTALEQGTYLPLLYGLPLAAAFLLEDGQAERAVELYALALEQPFVASSRWYADVVGQHVADAAATLPPEVVAAARERGRARDLWATARGLVAELAPEDG